MDNFAVLKNFLPEKAAVTIVEWIDKYDCDFTISKARRTRLGDYRQPIRGYKHRISVNHNLNPYAFLITTVHEFAHLQTWNQFKNTVKPHGEEWKSNFRMMMSPFFVQNIFPEDIKKALSKYLQNPFASGCSDLELFKTLARYNSGSSNSSVRSSLNLDTLPIGAVFALQNGRKFKKVEKLRKRYKCLELSTQRMYLISPVAEIFEC